MLRISNNFLNVRKSLLRVQKNPRHTVPGMNYQREQLFTSPVIQNAVRVILECIC